MKLKLFKKDNETQQKKDTAVQPDEEDPLTKYLDGMGSATARILIKRHLDASVVEKFGLKELKNTGRYYTAKIVVPGGKLIDEVLIDKQTGKIWSLFRRIGHTR